MLPYQILASATRGKLLKKLYKKNRFKISAPTLNNKFKSPDAPSNKNICR